MHIPSRNRTTLALLLLALPATAVLGQSADRGFSAADTKTDPGPAIQEVRIRVDDYKTKKDLGYLLEGDVLELATGDDVIVRVVAIPGGNQRAVRYPQARFKVLSGARRVNLFKANEEHGSVVIHAVRPDDPANSGSTTLVEFTITSPLNAHRKLMMGTFPVVIKDSPATTPTPTPPTQVDNGSRASEVAALLYRAILLREPDAAGAAPKIETIRTRGYDGILGVAADMAASSESRQDLYNRSVTVQVGGNTVTRPVNDEDRLLAMYRELLGMADTRAVPAAEWNRQLGQLTQGRLSEVLRELLLRPEFAQRYGVDWEAPYRARPR